MEVKVISIEIIRPTSPTPSHLKTFKLSFLDQINDLIYIPVIFHYPTSDCSRSTKGELVRLKNSLSETLSRFYPLAGRVKDHLSVDCNDEGVLFLEAEVNCSMSLLLKRPEIDLLDSLVPRVVGTEPANTLVQVAVQVNIFACGGIAIGVCVLHQIIDASTLNAFLKCWAAMASGRHDDSAIIYPNITVASSSFPPREQPPRGIMFGRIRGKMVQKRFVFNAAAITALKAKATSQLVPSPTRFQVVAGFIWKCAMTASRAVKGSQQPSTLLNLINLRPRMVPPLSEYSIGNIVWPVAVHHRAAARTDDRTELQVVVGLLREAFAKVDDDYILRLQRDEGVPLISKMVEEIEELHSNEKSDIFAFTSVKNFAFTELDFGWGNPIWVNYIQAFGSPVFFNEVVLAETRWDDGIEAWLTFGEHAMSILEHDPEFLSFASLNPSIYMPVARL